MALAYSVMMISGCGHSHNGDAHEHHTHSHEHHHHEHGHEHHDHHEHEHHTGDANIVHFSHEQAESVALKTEKVSLRPFGQVIRTSAQILPAQDDISLVSAPASGVVSFFNPNLAEGTFVKAGQKLFSIESSGMADGNMGVRYQEVEARYHAAEATYNRKKSLSEDKIVSQAELDNAKADYLAAKAEYDNLKGNFSKRGAVVSAPKSGYVLSIGVRGGGYVESGREVMVLTQNHDLHLRAEVQPRYYNKLKDIETINILIPGDTHVYTLDELQGSLLTYGRRTDNDCPLIPVTFRVRNTGSLISGGFVTTYIITKATQPVITAPNEAIVEEMGSHFVFVCHGEEEYEKRLVTLGSTDGFRTEITDGLHTDESIVTNGARMLRLAQGTAALDPHAGHVH